jgi:hypothetical protein
MAERPSDTRDAQMTAQAPARCIRGLARLKLVAGKEATPRVSQPESGRTSTSQPHQRPDGRYASRNERTAPSIRVELPTRPKVRPIRGTELRLRIEPMFFGSLAAARRDAGQPRRLLLGSYQSEVSRTQLATLTFSKRSRSSARSNFEPIRSSS